MEVVMRLRYFFLIATFSQVFFFFVYVINFLTDNFPDFFNSKKCDKNWQLKKSFELWLSCFRAPGQP